MRGKQANGTQPTGTAFPAGWANINERMKAPLICKKRLADIEGLFWSETNEEWTLEWREELTAEEANLVDEWDDRVAKGMYRLVERIVELDKKRKDGTDLR